VQVKALPIGNSDYTRLALTLPGATQNSNFAFAQYTINGSRSRSNAFFVGRSLKHHPPPTSPPSMSGNSATAATRLPLDAIQEVSVVSGGSADTGRMRQRHECHHQEWDQPDSWIRLRSAS